ncbi:MAG: ParB/RepB/Spo0J family partition protein [Actinomycetes bacterium]
MARRGGLGKGLGALIPQGTGEAAPVSGGGLEQVPVSAISPNKYQPRSHFDEEELTSLAESIRAVGVLQPVLLRPTGEGTYELIAGERRWRAARRVGLQSIPALVRETADTQSLEQALVENVHRSDLNPMEEAAAYQQLIEDFSMTHEQVAIRVGRSRASVTNTLRLLQLPPSVQRLVRDRALDMGHARALLASPDRAFQEALAKRASAEGLSVRVVEEAVRAHEGTPSANPPATPKSGESNTAVRAPALLELEQLLGDHLDTRVKVTMAGKRGRVVVEFSDLVDLERIYRAMTGEKL